MILNSTKDFPWNEDEDMLNCGSFALGVDEWYLPYDEDNHDKMLRSCIDEQRSIDDAYEIITAADINFMLEQFAGQVRICLPDEVLALDEELVAYRLGIDEISYDLDEVDIDFHFRRFQDGQWVEKCGSFPIQQISQDELEHFDDYWECTGMEYYGPIIYLAVKH